ncbi:hypothetical protein SDRG_10583 [Saprolegnia diclina VS20]|uniref:Uncharacterized protein n=1 Tax=Saprolegnia diclina (strain VS20) TaxID=1156394 RepID=T0Q1R7_SAPDV|nr:hypothetical protein SDRG_10583 [Saprolegnia diclina VS20]EQC31794.1 hypothetical protein SDRG_10583 [Saprolegnia diclina VS20]|eukprot:XP_008614801.1 hypothetical protein SDRG_10583 [Saprolegnia diclina VS20]
MQRFQAVVATFAASSPSAADDVVRPPAIVGPSIVVTFHELHELVTDVASALATAALPVVALALPLGVPQIAVLYGATITPSTLFVPIDEMQSIVRNRSLLRDAAATGLVCTPTSPLLAALRSELGGAVAVRLLTHALGDDIVLATWPSADMAPTWACDPDAMYVLYTSGSTGRPKGVIGSYAATWHRLDWMWATLPFGLGERVLRHTTLTFVDAIAEVFGTLCAGATLVLPSSTSVSFAPPVVADLAGFALSLRRFSVTRMTLVPSVLQLLLQMNLLPPSLRCVAVSGEPLHADLVATLFATLPSVQLLHLYGSTEVAGDATFWLTTTAAAPVPVGTAIGATKLRLVDASGVEITSDKTRGELYIGGPPLARGYVNMSDNEAHRFCTLHGERWFKTGDVAYFAEGLLYLCGRNDGYVKVSGVQVHVPAIESSARMYLGRHHRRWKVAIAPVASSESWHQLDTVVLCVGIDDEAVDTDALRHAVERAHPRVAMHVLRVPYAQFPETSSGKADPSQIPALFAQRSLPSWLRALLPTGGLASTGYTPSLVDPSLTLTELGLNSMAMAIVLHTLQTQHETTLRPVELADMTVAALQLLVQRKRRRVVSPDASAMKRARVTLRTDAVRWQVPVRKCIDASPRLAMTSTGEYIVVGSHDHTVLCTTADGQVVWRKELPDRVESSAAMTADRLVVGCYDGGVYCLEILTGSTLWVYFTQDQVKCSPVVVEEENAVVVGSHDHHVYGLALDSGACLFKLPFTKSVFSSPVYAAKVLYCASLAGEVRAYAWPSLRMHEAPTPLWQHTCTAPVFCSLRLGRYHDLLLVGCADASLYALSTTTGTPLWSYATTKPIFSAPSVATMSDGSEAAVFGSHDGVVRCVSMVDGTCIASVDLGCAVYASPATLPDRTTLMACVCTTNGHVYLWEPVVSSRATLLFHGAGDIFSSPLALKDGCIVVGTRGDVLLALSLPDNPHRNE